VDLSVDISATVTYRSLGFRDEINWTRNNFTSQKTSQFKSDGIEREVLRNQLE